ncbi:MAG: hypothetical protein KGL12_16345 [Rhodospirillales bacterium]|nr:hypothetical protein [Rhodospirillales bacterium]
MEALRLLLQRYLRAAWRRRWLGIALAWLICGLGWVGVYLVPNEFESSARLYVNADAILTPLLRGIAAESSPEAQLQVLQRTLLSRPNLEKLISKTDLDLQVNNATDRERLISQLSANIKVTPQTANLFTISYRNPNPRLARDVVQTLLTIFVESATGGNRTDMENARRFLEHQIASYEQQLRAAERRRADFRAKYMDILPSDMSPGVSAVENARNQVTTIEGQLQDAIMKRDAIKQELQTTPAMLVVESGASGLNPNDQANELQQAELRLQQLLQVDTDQHPDVIAQRRLIAALEKAPKTPAKAAADLGPKRSVPNPVYDQLKVALVQADGQVGSLQRQADDSTRYLDRLEKIQREQPGLIAEYQNMDRDYGVLRKNYEELLSRLQSANIAQAADTTADKVKLQIVDPPTLPRLPVAPNRLLLITGVLILGLGAGGTVMMLLGQLDRSFTTVDDLRAIGLPVLGGISILTLPPFRQRFMTVARFAAALLALVMIYGGIITHILRSSALI